MLTDARSAAGASFAPGVGSAGTQYASKVRYRRWLTDSSSTELGLGVFHGKTHRGFGNGITTRFGSIVTTDLRRGFDWTVWGTAMALYGGLAVGTEPALAVTLGIGANVLIVVGVAAIILGTAGT